MQIFQFCKVTSSGKTLAGVSKLGHNIIHGTFVHFLLINALVVNSFRELRMKREKDWQQNQADNGGNDNQRDAGFGMSTNLYIHPPTAPSCWQAYRLGWHRAQNCQSPWPSARRGSALTYRQQSTGSPVPKATVGIDMLVITTDSAKTTSPAA